NFENDTALGAAHALLAKLVTQIEKRLARSPRTLDRLYAVNEAVLANVELTGLIAAHLFASAAARAPIWLPLLPAPDTIAAWKTNLLTAWDRLIDPKDADPDYLRERRQTIATSLDRLAELSRQ